MRSPSAFWILLPLCATQLGANSCSDSDYMVPMRDGVKLATTTYPLRETAPVILMRTPYDKEGLSGYGPALNQSGYAFVAQDLRGRYASDGDFMMFRDDGWGATQDGFDTVEWSASQSFSNGDVCMWGGSALAISSLLAAGSTPPHLRCAYSLVGSGDLYGQVSFWGGSLREEMVVGWLSGLGESEALEQIYQHYLFDEWWAPVDLPSHEEGIDVPIYHVGGWYDIFGQGTLDAFSGAEERGGPGARGRQKLLLGPWSHQSAGGLIGELTFPANSNLPAGEDMRWFDHWLRGVENGVDTESPVKYYLMGDVDTPSEQWNVWKEAESWPVPSTPTAFYLHGGGGLSTGRPGSQGNPALFTFDPADPVPTVGGNNLVIPAGPYDQRSVEGRPDVLVFSSEVLSAPLAITGRVAATLWVASSAVDTDFTVKLTDVYPDGRSMLLQDGIARLRFREGFDHEVMMVPGEIYEVEVDLWSTAHVFNAGHQIRVAVSSSNSPRFDVNANNGAHPYLSDAAPVVADQTLFLDQSHPSNLLLPVVPL